MRKSALWVTFILFGLTIITGFYLRSESWIGTTVRRPIQSDASDYFYYAFNMRYHHTYSRDISQAADSKYKISPDAVRSPGYPLMLSLLIDAPPQQKIDKEDRALSDAHQHPDADFGFLFFSIFFAAIVWWGRCPFGCAQSTPHYL